MTVLILSCGLTDGKVCHTWGIPIKRKGKKNFLLFPLHPHPRPCRERLDLLGKMRGLSCYPQSSSWITILMQIMGKSGSLFGANSHKMPTPVEFMSNRELRGPGNMKEGTGGPSRKLETHSQPVWWRSHLFQGRGENEKVLIAKLMQEGATQPKKTQKREKRKETMTEEAGLDRQGSWRSHGWSHTPTFSLCYHCLIQATHAWHGRDHHQLANLWTGVASNGLALNSFHNFPSL